jgi:TM2 domain-containing membrane protein YozV
MSNGNDDWGNAGGDDWGTPDENPIGDSGQDGWDTAPSPAPNMPDPGFQQPQAQPGGPGQTQPQQGGFSADGPAPAEMVHQKKGGADKLETNDFVAMAVSFFVPGVGHIILGQTTRGIALLAAFVFTCNGFGLLPFLALADAYFVALTQKYRQVDDWEFFPDYKEHI